jgi:hypothetical protein
MINKSIRATSNDLQHLGQQDLSACLTCSALGEVQDEVALADPLRDVDQIANQQ